MKHKLVNLYYRTCEISLFVNGPGDRDLVIPKTQKIVPDASLFNTQEYKLQIKGKWSNPGKGDALSPTPRCGSYRKWKLRVALDYSRQLYF